MLRVSVVVKTSNAQGALLATADTILHQSYPELELLVCDDGSTDRSGTEFLSRWGPDPARVEQVWQDSLREESGNRTIQFSRSGTSIYYLHQTSARGPSAARNRAIALASGELLAFARAGDLWRPWKLRTQVELMDRHADFGACAECDASRRARKSGPRKLPEISSVTFEEILLGPGPELDGALFRRRCLEQEAFDENLPVCEDFDFWLRVASHHPVGRAGQPMQLSGERPKTCEWGLERFRVYALEKAYQGGHLTSAQRHRVAEELVRQCDLLVDGYRCRNNQERANFYDRKKKRFAQEVTKLDLSDPEFSGARLGRNSLSGAGV